MACYETNFGWESKPATKENEHLPIDTSNTPSDFQRSDNDLHRNTIPKVDRHGFVVSHQNHNKVSSLPNPSHIGDKGKRRELKWLSMISNWDQMIKKNPNKIKKRCYKGVPQSIRSLAWQNLSGALSLKMRNQVTFKVLIENCTDSEWIDVIKKDIPRTFRHHSMFYESDSQGQEDLTKVLVAFSCYDTSVGYNQALAPVVAILLIHMPPEEAFWVLVSICTYYLPGYYGEKMEAMRLDGLIFTELLDAHLPNVAKYMKKNNIDPLMYIVEWMVCIYARCLPFQTVLRIWDMFFCEGVKVLFKVGIAILKLVFSSKKELAKKDDFEITQTLNNLPKDYTTELILIPAAQSIDISRKDLEAIHKRILKSNKDLDITRFAGVTAGIVL